MKAAVAYQQYKNSKVLTASPQSSHLCFMMDASSSVTWQ